MHMHNVSYNLSRAYGLASNFVKELRQRNSFNRLHQSLLAISVNGNR
jgi:hypothetical protein